MTNLAGCIASVLLAAAGTMAAVTTAAAAADIPGDSTTRTSLALSPTYTRSTFDSRQDHDWYRVTLEAGKDYAFAASDAQASLRQPDGKVVARSTDGIYINGFYFRPPVSGTYFLDAAALPDEFYQTSYGVRVMTDCAADATTRCGLTLGKTRKSTATYDADIDWFRVTLDATKHYMFTAKAPGCCSFDIRDAAGNYLARTGTHPGGPDETVRNFSPPVSGAYYVTVLFEDGAADYDLTFKYETDTSLPPSLGDVYYIPPAP